MLKRLDHKFWGIHSVLSLLIVVLFIIFYPEVDTDENGLLEWLQSGFIALSFFIFSFNTFVSQSIKKRIISFGLALLSLTFLLRELDIEKFDLPLVLITLGSGSGRNILLGTLWVVLFALLYKYKRYFDKSAIETFLFSRVGQLLMFSATMLILGAMMDKNIFSLETLTTRFYEEVLELLGYVYLSIASMKIYYLRE